MVDVLLAGILGAAVLAITLLYQKQQKQAKQLDQLHAEVTAQKIAALQQLTPAALAPPKAPPEPAHRKRHLALYIGGGVAAVLASFGKRIRSLIPRRTRGVTAAVTTLTITVASTAAAFYLTSGSGDSAPSPGSSLTPSATAPEHPSPKATSMDRAASPSTSPTTADTPGANTTSQQPQPLSTSGPTSTSAPSTPEPSTPEPSAPTTHTPTPTSRPSTTPPAPGAPTPSAPTTHEPTPTTQPSTTPPGPSAPTPTPPATVTPSPDDPDTCLCSWFPWLPQCADA